MERKSFEKHKRTSVFDVPVITCKLTHKVINRYFTFLWAEISQHYLLCLYGAWLFSYTYMPYVFEYIWVLILFWYLRAFVERNYKELKTLNPKLPILIRECSGVEPQLWARYGTTIFNLILYLLHLNFSPCVLYSHFVSPLPTLSCPGFYNRN